MAVNKVVLGENTLIDLTGDTVSADKLSKGVTAHDMKGEPIVGTMEAGGGKEYTFTDGLTETDGVVKWDLSDRIKAGANKNSVAIGSKYNAATGENSLAAGGNSLSSNYGNRATQTGAAAFGIATQAAGYASMTTGSAATSNYSYMGIIASGSSSFAGGRQLGTNNNAIKASGAAAFAFGVADQGSVSAEQQGSFAMGLNVSAKSAYQHARGKNNIFDSDSTYCEIIGNGTSYTSCSNAYTLDWQGNGTFAGTVSSSTGADYAEYFEWKDGNPNNEDRVGYIVTLDGDKIVKANSGDDILGICSGTAMVLGDSAEWNWSKRYLTDDFGRIIYEDRVVEHEAIYSPEGEVIEEAWTEHIHAPKQNPEYDSSQPYIKRADRPEWQIVGMMGKIYVRDDGSCVVNGYADVKDGIATKANGKTNMRVMERVTDNIVRVMMK